MGGLTGPGNTDMCQRGVPHGSIKLLFPNPTCSRLPLRKSYLSDNPQPPRPTGLASHFIPCFSRQITLPSDGSGVEPSCWKSPRKRGLGPHTRTLVQLSLVSQWQVASKLKYRDYWWPKSLWIPSAPSECKADAEMQEGTINGSDLSVT